MILANVAAAEMLEKKALPLIYRVHDEPSQEKVHNPQGVLKTLDLPFAKSGALRPALFNRVLGQVRGEDYEPLVNEVVLRSQAQAAFGGELRPFRPQPAPLRAFHFADQAIRRPDRASRADPRARPRRRRVAGNRDAGDAERSRRRFRDRAPRHEGGTRDGRPADRAFPRRPHRRRLLRAISGVTRAGLFVKLSDTGADGLIPIRTLGTEYYNYDETRHALVGSRSGAMHRLGDVVDVRLVEAAPVAGALRFELLSEGQVIPRGRKRDGSKASTKTSKSHPAAARATRFASPTRQVRESQAGKSKKGKSWKR